MESLKSERRWCLWKRENVNGRETKVPYQSLDVHASSNNSVTWLSYDEANTLYESNQDEFSGLGVFFSERSTPGVLLCGIDIDTHNSTDGNPNAEPLLEQFSDTYIERSPSGTGYHILCNVDQSRLPLNHNGKLDYKKKNSDLELEIYIGGLDNRYFTFTGNAVHGSVITDQTDNVLRFLDQYMQTPAIRRSKDLLRRIETREIEKPTFMADVNIDERLDMARHAKNSNKFIALYDNGDISQYRSNPGQDDGDHSSADLALTRMLYFWMSGNEEAVDDAFRRSRLYRDKWDEPHAADGRTYGQMTIDKVSNNPCNIYIPPERSVSGTAPQWSAELGDRVIEEPPINDTSVDNVPITPEDILQMINEAEDDEEHRDMITVYPLLCGSGKSTAIRLKMRQIIEENDGSGMIIVTDNLDRMRAYVSEGDPDLTYYFEDHSELITVMTHETIMADRSREKKSPILIMSTQRYVNLSKDEVNQYLTWDGGSRNLIIVDEQPIFKRVVTLTNESIGQIIAAINSLPTHIENVLHERQAMLYQWQSWKMDFERLLGRYRSNTWAPGQYYTLCKPTTRLDEEGRHVFYLCEKYKHALNTFRGRREYIDIFNNILAFRQLIEDYGLAQMRVERDGNSNVSISVLLDNHSNYTDLDAKVIILDGTADISPVYDMYDDIFIADCSRFKRKLDHLHIVLVDVATGKSTLSNTEKLDEVINFSKELFGEVNSFPPDDPRNGPVIFSYKDFYETFLHSFGNNNITYSWFGKIKGSNDFRQAKYIAQIGVNRFSDGCYFLYQLDSDPALRQQLEDLQLQTDAEVVTPVDEMRNGNREIKGLIGLEDGYTANVRANEILADTEQNLFRGIIRNSNNTEDYTFYLFTSLRWPGNRLFLNKLHERYSALHANFTTVDLPAHRNDPINHIMRPDNPSIAFHIITWHDTKVEMNVKYSTDDIIHGVSELMHEDISREQFQAAKRRSNNRTLHDLLENEKLRDDHSRPTKYRKTSNWYYDTREDE